MSQDKCAYVHVEMILNKKDKAEVVAGLFTGYKVSNAGEKYIVLTGPDNAVFLLNVDYYNILKIEELRGDFRDMTYLTNSEEDQKHAAEALKALYEELVAEEFLIKNTDTIIDVSKYDSVPKEYLEGKDINTKSPNTINGKGSYNQSNTYSSSGKTYQNSSYTPPPPKKERKPSVFARTEKGPGKDALSAMLGMVKAVDDGTFESAVNFSKYEDTEEGKYSEHF